MIDTHCHLNHPALADRVPAVLAAAADHDVHHCITIGTTLTDAPELAALASTHPCISFTVGLHPHDAARWHGQAHAIAEMLTRWAAHPRCVGLGEMGLDHHYPTPSRDHQIAAFTAQLEAVQTIDASTDDPLPIVIHNREATDDTLADIADSGLPGSRFLFHCFTGTPAEADRILALGASIGFTGVVTFPSAPDVAAASDRVPLDRLLIETDSPYLTPAPFRKVKPNEPRYVADVARFLAHRRGLSTDEFTAAVDANAYRLFPKLPTPSA